ncbi:polycystic kidney disease protein 1-like 2 [Protopterus annectens]|uniref:polycystic kidney disease protein 1-like 2 n=1 Tax=Protopterus annectens TaxID=7888 RepID=UPI001CFA93B8|nr:polycystic kidney disease protein 1-like 2 [Protopterus annectens]
MSLKLQIIPLFIFLTCHTSQACVLFCTGSQMKFEDSCYEFVRELNDFASARSFCEMNGGQLAYIQDENTQTILQPHLSTAQNWWVGLTKANKNAKSKPSSGYLTWIKQVIFKFIYKDPGLPQSPLFCAYIPHGQALRWTTTPFCNQTMFSICEYGICQHKYKSSPVSSFGKYQPDLVCKGNKLIPFLIKYLSGHIGIGIEFQDQRPTKIFYIFL